jgi:hypothetical protein
MFYFHYNCEKIEERQNAEQKKIYYVYRKEMKKKNQRYEKEKISKGKIFLINMCQLSMYFNLL